MNTKYSKYYYNNKTNKLVPKSQAGLSTFDLVLWFTVAAVIIAAWFGLVSPMMTSAKANNILGELNLFQMKIREAYNGQEGGYAGITVQEVVKSKAYPTSVNVNGGALQSPSFGAVTMASSDGSGNSFSVTYAAVPSNVCQSIISKLAIANGWVEIDVNGAKIWSGNDSMPQKSVIDQSCRSGSVPMTFISN